MKPKIQIIIPCINLWNKYTKVCIDSIKTKYEYRILLIDNGSTDETKIEAGKLVSNNFAHLRNEESWSCAKSWNYGIRDGLERGYDYILILNNDILLHPEAINKLVERFENKKLIEGVRMLSPTIDETKRDLPVYEGLAMVSCLDIRSECPTPQVMFLLSPEKKIGVEESEHPNFSAFMINKECWEIIGEFDEEFNPCYFEDNDYHYRIKNAGMKALTIPTAMFYHFGSKTQNEANKEPVCSGFQFEKNRLYYKHKWGGLPSEEKYKIPFNEPNDKEI